MVITIKLGGISGNVYLVKSEGSFVLIDTGVSFKRSELEKKLEDYQCIPGMLKCILLTHGDFDHSGNALYLSKKYNCPLGIHKNDAVVLKTGDMFVNRKKNNKVVGFLVKKIIGIKPFIPDFYLEDSQDLNEYGFDGFLIHTPGHSPGSVCLITAARECFCGDLFENIKIPQLNSIVDDLNEMKNSAKKVLKYNCEILYPGHGNAFKINEIELK